MMKSIINKILRVQIAVMLGAFLITAPNWEAQAGEGVLAGTELTMELPTSFIDLQLAVTAVEAIQLAVDYPNGIAVGPIVTALAVEANALGIQLGTADYHFNDPLDNAFFVGNDYSIAANSSNLPVADTLTISYDLGPLDLPAGTTYDSDFTTAQTADEVGDLTLVSGLTPILSGLASNEPHCGTNYAGAFITCDAFDLADFDRVQWARVSNTLPVLSIATANTLIRLEVVP